MQIINKRPGLVGARRVRVHSINSMAADWQSARRRARELLSGTDSGLQLFFSMPDFAVCFIVRPPPLPLSFHYWLMGIKFARIKLVHTCTHTQTMVVAAKGALAGGRAEDGE